MSKLISFQYDWNTTDENENAEKYVYKKLEETLKDTSGILYPKPKIFYYNSEVNPDILWLSAPTKGILVIEVKAWSYDFLRNATVESGGRYICVHSRKYLNPIREADQHKTTIFNLIRSKNLLDVIVDYAVAFPNLTREEFNQLDNTLKHHINISRCIFKDDFKDKDKLLRKLASLLHSRYGYPIQESYDCNWIQLVRGILFPELTIGKEFLNGITSDDIPILDEVQEKLLRSVSKGLRILRGAPGSGKTVTLVGKAIYEKLYKRTIYGSKRILILTFTRILTEEMREMIQNIIKYKELEDVLSVDDFDIYTVHSLVRKLCDKYGVPWNSGEDIDEAIERLLKIDFDEEDKYDVILCDEVQDFGRNWFKLIDHLKKENSILILSVDETQRIYDRSIWKWKDVGIEARGRRVIILRRSYRSPARFLRASIEFLNMDKGLIRELRELEGINLDEIDSIKDTEEKIRLYIGNEYEIIRKVINDALRRGYEYGDIYVLSPFKRHIESIHNKLLEHLGEDVLHLVHSDIPIIDKKPPKDKILLTTYPSSKGLENKVVIVTGLHLLPRKTSENNPSLTPKQLERIDRKRVYVAMTRAMDLLYLTAYKMVGFAKELCNLKDVEVKINSQ